MLRDFSVSKRLLGSVIPQSIPQTFFPKSRCRLLNGSKGSKPLTFHTRSGMTLFSGLHVSPCRWTQGNNHLKCGSRMGTIRSWLRLDRRSSPVSSEHKRCRWCNNPRGRCRPLEPPVHWHRAHSRGWKPPATGLRFLLQCYASWQLLEELLIELLDR
jgi:hypothetical protein